MEQLGEPIEISQEFMNLLKKSIIPEYHRLLKKLFKELKEELKGYTIDE